MSHLLSGSATALSNRTDAFAAAGVRPLDTLTRAEAEAAVAACVAAGAPARFALTLAGEVQLEPADAGDVVFGGLLDDQLRRADDEALGADAAAVVGGLFRAAGWKVRVTDTPTRWDASETALVEEWLDEWLAAAVEERPALREWAAEYRASRQAQLASGVLSVVLHHTDLLAWPR